jgi:hypothetical protein
MGVCCCSSKPDVQKNNRFRCNTKCNNICNDDEVIEKKDRIQFDLNTIIKANTIKKSQSLGNYKGEMKIKLCNQKLSYLNIIEKLQNEIDSIILEILNYDFKRNNIDQKKISHRNIEYLKNILQYKTDSRNHYLNLINDIIGFKELDRKLHRETD